MNRMIPKIGSVIVTVTVFFFAVFLITGFSNGQYFVCSLLPIGYIMMSAGIQNESSPDRRVAANTGLVLAAVYALLVLLVYFSQNTYVAQNDLNEQAESILRFKPGSLTFCYDLLGYGMMALSTFFLGLSMQPDNKPDKWLKWLLMIHGAFFPGCFFMPMTGVFSGSSGSGGSGGTVALVAWCVYFLPIGILAFMHFGKRSE